MLLNPGSVLGDRYEIIEKIGSGGMAVVYRGKDKKLDRYVTIKVLREEFIGDEEFIERHIDDIRWAYVKDNIKISRETLIKGYTKMTKEELEAAIIDANKIE